MKANLKPYGSTAELRDLIDRLNHGDITAFNALYHKCSGYISFVCRKFCTPQDAEEIVQDTFVIAYKKAAELKPETLLAYLRKIAIHECYRRNQANQRRYQIIAPTGDVPTDLIELNEDFLPEEALSNYEYRNEVLGLVASLPRMQREAVYLYYFAELDVSEIASLMQCTHNNVYQTLYTAKKSLKKRMERNDGHFTKKAAASAMVGLGAVLLLQEQTFAAVYVPAAAPAMVFTAGGTVGATAFINTVLGKVCLAAACVLSVGFMATYVYLTYNAPHNYEPPDEAPLLYTTIPPPLPTLVIITIPEPTPEPTHAPLPTPAPTTPPATTAAPTAPPPPAPTLPPPPIVVDRTQAILLALQTAQTHEDVTSILHDYDFARVDQMERASGKRYRFYIRNEGSGDILVGVGFYDDGTGWHKRFALYTDGTRPVDVLDLLLFMGQ